MFDFMANGWLSASSCGLHLKTYSRVGIFVADFKFNYLIDYTYHDESMSVKIYGE